MRQISAAVVKCACLGHTVEAVDKLAVPEPCSDCARADSWLELLLQLTELVSCVAASPPADCAVCVE